MIRLLKVALLGLVLVLSPVAVVPAAAAGTLTWTGDDDITRYKSAPATATAGATTIVFENSAATGNTTGMPHTLTFDTTTDGYNHDVSLNILASPFDANNGRHTATVTLTPGKYRYFCSIPGHSTMTGEFTVTAGPAEPDTTAPVVSAQVTGDRNPAGEYLGTATVAVTAADTGSGVDTVEYQVDDTSWTRYTAPVAVTAAGDHAVQFRATDKAGNVSAVGSVPFTVAAPGPADTTPPVVSAQVSGDRDAAGAYLVSATVTLSATDAGSGVARIEYNVDGGAFRVYTAPVVVTTAGTHMVHFRATDVAGNTAAEQMASFTVAVPPAQDTTPPVTSAAVRTGADGSAVVTLTATDAGSGVASIEYALDAGAWAAYTSAVVVRAPGPHTLRHRATDVAGNRAPERSVTFTVVPPATGDCPVPDTRATVIIGTEDTRVPNADSGNGCTINDLIAERAGYPTHAAFVRHVETVTAPLVSAGKLTVRQQGTIVRAAARSAVVKGVQR